MASVGNWEAPIQTEPFPKGFVCIVPMAFPLPSHFPALKIMKLTSIYFPAASQGQHARWGIAPSRRHWASQARKKFYP
jgi:hypothetical protein